MCCRMFGVLVNFVSGHILALLVFLWASGSVWAADTDWTLHLELTAMRASPSSEHAPPAHTPLPFLDRKTYHADAFSQLTWSDQGDEDTRACTDAACPGLPGAGNNRSVVLYDPQQFLEFSIFDFQNTSYATSERVAALLEKSAYVGVVDVGIVMVMRQLPASFTKWTSDRYTEKTPLRQWQQHVSTPPVVDKDIPTVNVSHAYSGSSYYTLCRHTPGYTSQETRHMLECLLYTAAMSTFWEYGPEAFLEVPSIQDLIVTPVGGAVLGELFHLLQRQVVANGGKLLGSKVLGRTVIVLLNPMEEVVQGLRELAGPVVDHVDLRLHLTYGNLVPDLLQPTIDPTRADTMLQLQVTGKWPVKRAERRK